MICCPPTAILVWTINTEYTGSLGAFWEHVLDVGFFHVLASAWGPVLWGTEAGWRIVGVFAVVQLLLMRLVPGRRFQGPVTPSGHVP